MRRAIVLPTYGGDPWLPECLESLKDSSVKLIALGGPDIQWEMGKMKWIIENTNIDEFLFWQTSMICKDISVVDMFFSTPGSVALCNCPVPFGMYAGKFESERLRELDLWVPIDKGDSVRGELWLGQNYASLGPYTTLFPRLHDVTATELEDRHGRTNLILENEFVKKYKGTWTYGEGGYFDIVIGVEGKRWADEALNEQV